MLTLRARMIIDEQKAKDRATVPDDGWPARFAGPDNAFTRFLFVRFANFMASFYDAPVYLVGSSLRDDNPNPRDYDMRCILSDRDFFYRFGGTAAEWMREFGRGDWTEVSWRQSDECVRRTKEAWTHCCARNVDFQIYPETFAVGQYAHLPRFRLDTHPRVPDRGFNVNVDDTAPAQPVAAGRRKG